MQYDRLNSLLKNSIFQNIELSEVDRYSIISSACKLAVLRKNVPGFLASKEEIEKWNDPNGARKLSIVTKDLISSDKNSSNKWIQLNKNLKAYILAFLTGDLGDYHNYSQVLTILRKSPYSKSMLKLSNVSSNILSNDKPFDDFSGNGLLVIMSNQFSQILKRNTIVMHCINYLP
ncbi:hypothetical protein [Candidatus Lariskella endosymbiont of Hedychridium roseum]|uniref:hypothetical protein n=1 Tax=Candidatus Lariskella endosymbiont of Hedychridium roseum TaxID=3077949 RepID=UPI0030D11D3C